MGDGYSAVIKIQRGTPQGDRASPFIFIIAIEVFEEGGRQGALDCELRASGKAPYPGRACSDKPRGGSGGGYNSS